MKKKLSTLNFQLSTVRGFSLVGFLVVVAILIILGTQLLKIWNPLDPFFGYRDDLRKKDLAKIQKALEDYREDFRKYPLSKNNKIRGIDWGLNWSPYLSVIPQDPDYPKKTYVYWSDSRGDSYRLYTSLDRVKDPHVCRPDLPSGGPCSFVPDDATCGGICNYGVSSRNTSF